MSFYIKVADEVWIGCALLHVENPNKQSFFPKEIINRIKRENIFGTLRTGIIWHVNLHCVANKPPNPANYRMLYALPDGTLRLFKESDDYHPRKNGKIMPNSEDIPQKYQYLLEWYEIKYNQSRVRDKVKTLSITKPTLIELNIEVIPVLLSTEHELKSFSYECPKGFSNLSKEDCKKCSLRVEEDEVKKAIGSMLKADGWTIRRMALQQRHGADIEATHDSLGTMIIEAKGEGSLNPMRVNYFLMILGELLQKMDDPDKQYGVGLPAYRQFANLIVKLPLWIKQYLKLKVFLVKKLDAKKYAVGYLYY